MKIKSVGRILALLTLLASGPVVAATDYYVDGKSGVQGNPGTQALPFPTIYQAEDVAQPGDTVHILPTTTYSQLGILASGSAAAPITYVGGNTTVTTTAVTGQGATSQGNAIWINANYVVVKGFSATAPGPYSAIDVAKSHHHIWIKNNIAHDSGGDGINAASDDYVWIEYNVVYGNAKYTTTCVFGSGISVLQSVDIDTATSVKTSVIGNKVYGNTNTPTVGCGGNSLGLDSDGNGIIIDRNNGQQNNLPYNGRTLIANNVIYGNGGRGVHIYQSNHVTVTSNTTYYNNQDPAEGNYLPGEIEANSSGDVTIYDNILYSDGGLGEKNGLYTGYHVGISFQSCPSSGGGDLIAEYNLIFNPNLPVNPVQYELAACRNSPTIPVIVAANLWGNPLFVTPSVTSGTASFDIKATSPALAAANPQDSVSTDIKFYPRPIIVPVSGPYTPPTDGAYELAAP